MTECGSRYVEKAGLWGTDLMPCQLPPGHKVKHRFKDKITKEVTTWRDEEESKEWSSTQPAGPGGRSKPRSSSR